MGTKEDAFENDVRKAYRRFTPLAARYHYTFTRPALTVGGTPCVLFLGNHSSGKSSLINWIVGGESVQDTGVAPTDDGFTVLVYGETEEDVCGPAALARLPEEFKVFESFGPNFLQHLKVKIRTRDFLRHLVVIDSPGMIDTAEGTSTRGYDFQGAVRRLAELSDSVFFLFDPEKPGTTGETVEVFAQALRGIEFKLHVLLNKCDVFASMYDFARTYGTICWNLGRVMHTKDLPKIYTTYTGEPPTEAKIDLTDFNRHREDFKAILQDGGGRRADNVFASVHTDFTGLSIRMAVLNHVARAVARLRLRNLALVGLFLPLVGCCGLFTVSNLLGRPVLPEAGQSLVPSIFAGVVAAVLMGLAGWIGYWLHGLSVTYLRRRLAKSVDGIFAEEYRSALAVGAHDDLRQTWGRLRDETADLVRDVPLNLPLFGERRRRQLESALARLLSTAQKQ